MSIKFLIFLASVISNVILQDADFQNFLNMVQGNLSSSLNYQFPKNNEKLVATTQNIVYDFGEFDFIIVGGGSAGTLLSNRLSEITNWNILLLEAGGDENDFTAIPGMSIYLQNSDMNWGYFTTPQTTCCLGMFNHSCIVSRGKVLGGCSVLNAKMYVRGNKADYDIWEAMDNKGWSYKNVLPYFIKTENTSIYNGDPGYHSTQGLLHVQYTDPTIFTQAYLDGMKELGVPQLDYNGINQLGASSVQFNIKGNKIASGRRSFIDPIRCRKNLKITLNAFATKILINPQSKVATGVEFIHDEKKFQAKATKEVILSAGVYNSPQILMLSGIGPKDELNRLGIPVIQDLPVGKNLEEHPAFLGFIVRTNKILYNESIEDALRQYLKGHRPLTNPMNVDSLSFLKVNRGFLNEWTKQSSPNIQQILVVPSGFQNNFGTAFNFNDDITQSLKENYNPYSDLLVILILLHSKSRGTVTLKSANPKDFPSIDYRMFSDPHNIDIDTMYHGIMESFKLLDTQPFKALNASFIPVIKGCEAFHKSSEDYWYCTIRHMTATIYHPIGTTRMGSCPKHSVVNSELNVHGINKLRVIDAGSIPYMPSGNINTAVYMMAEKSADIIKKYFGVL